MVAIIAAPRRQLIAQRHIITMCRSLRSLHPFLHSAPLCFAMFSNQPDPPKVTLPVGASTLPCNTCALYTRNSAFQIASWWVQPLLHSSWQRRKRKGKEMYLYSAILVRTHTLKALRHGSHSFTCKQHHVCLSFVSIHQMALPLKEAADIELQLTTHLSTPKR